MFDGRSAVVRKRVWVTTGALVIIAALFLAPAMAFAATPKVDVPSWVTDLVNQVKAVAQQAADQLKPLAQTAVAQVKQVGVTLVASLKSARSFADLKAALSKAVADTKAIADAFKAAATPIVQAAVAQIQVLITAAMPNVAALNAQVKAKVMEIINGLKQYFPVVPKVA